MHERDTGSVLLPQLPRLNVLTRRQREVAELVARGLSDKAIARELDCSVRTVEAHIAEAARRIEGEGRPRHRLTLWFLSPEQDSDAA